MLILRDLSEVLVAATLLQSVAFALFLVTDRFRASRANRFLCAALLLMAAVKADQLYQLVGGLRLHPEWGFLLAPLQPLLTPALFFFVRARTIPEFRLRPAHAAHLIPAMLYLAYLSTAWFRLGVEDKRALIEAGALAAPLHSLVVPVLSDLLQIGYIAASLVVLSRYGLSLDRWFSRVDDKNLSWLKQLLTLWAAAFVLHLVFVVGQGLDQTPAGGAGVMLALNAAHFVFINLLLVLAIVDDASGARPSVVAKYAGSTQTPVDRSRLFLKAREVLVSRALFLDPDLTLQGLAEAVGTASRDLSEAINGAGNETFFSFVNKARIDFAKARLRDEANARILDIALASGFNSKSTFNDTFRKYAGMTPSAWRAAAPEMGATAPSAAE